MTSDPVLVESADELPDGSSVVYHLAGEQDIGSILDEGLDPTKHISDHSEALDFLETVGDGDSVSDRPDSRQDCVFAYVDKETAVHVADNLTAEILLAIDLQAVSEPLYASDCSAFTAVTRCADYDTEYDWDDAHDSYTNDDTETPAWEAVETARDYWEQFQPVSAGSSLSRATSGMTKPEVLIEGWVPVAAITHVYAGRRNSLSAQADLDDAF